MEYKEYKIDKELKDIKKLLIPVKNYVEEKKELGIYDDFDEYQSALKKIEYYNNKFNIEDINIYTVEDKKKVIAVLMLIKNKEYIKEEIDIENYSNVALLSSFYVSSKYRGIGSNWLIDYVFKRAKEENIKYIYVKSSHYKAFRFYERLGSKIAEYKFLSDNNMYLRLGNVYKISL